MNEDDSEQRGLWEAPAVISPHSGHRERLRDRFTGGGQYYQPHQQGRSTDARSVSEHPHCRCSLAAGHREAWKKVVRSAKELACVQLSETTMYRTVNAIAAMCAFVAGSSAALALECGGPEDILRYIPQEDRAVSRMVAANVLARSDLAFEGRLVKETRTPPVSTGASGPGFGSTLYEFRDVRWLKGPKLGQNADKLSFFKIWWCTDCEAKRLVTVHDKNPLPDRVWLGDWPRAYDRAKAKTEYQIEPDVAAGFCDTGWAQSDDKDVQSELDLAIERMRAAAAQEAQDIAALAKK